MTTIPIELKNLVFRRKRLWPAESAAPAFDYMVTTQFGRTMYAGTTAYAASLIVQVRLSSTYRYDFAQYAMCTKSQWDKTYYD